MAACAIVGVFSTATAAHGQTDFDAQQTAALSAAAEASPDVGERRELVLVSHDAVVTCIQNFAADTNKKTRAQLGFLIGGGGGS